MIFSVASIQKHNNGRVWIFSQIRELIYIYINGGMFALAQRCESQHPWSFLFVYFFFPHGFKIPAKVPGNRTVEKEDIHLRQ